MKLLVVDADGVALDFAMRAAEREHQVKLFIRPHQGERDRTGDGLVEKVPDWEKWVQWADLIVPTMNSFYLDRLEGLRRYSYPIFGPSKESARLETERAFGMQAFKKAGIEVPPYKMFTSLDVAEAYAWKTDRPLVFKTLGSEDDKSLSYVARDPADMVNQLRRWKKQGMALKGPAMLQDRIEGVELGVSAWMGRDGFLRPRGENVEHKKLMSGNFGPNTGEMGTLMWYTTRSKLARAVLDPLEGYLRSIGHIGDIDVNCHIDAKGKAWPLEFTARLGWPAFYVMCAQHEEPCQWMLDALNGKDSLTYSGDVWMGLLLAQPNFPYKGSRTLDVTGIPIQGITHENWPNVHLIAAMVGKGVEMVGEKPKEKDVLVTTGEYVLVASGAGSSIKKARKAAYQVVSEVHVPNAIVRDDIGLEFMNQLPNLQKDGYATAISA